MKIACFVEAYNFRDKSEKSALGRFKSAAENMGHSFEFIHRGDMGSIQEFDALFIRATTDPANTAYIFSRLAEQHGLRVIDDSHSIRTCSNKAILHDLFLKNHIPAPKSILFMGDYSKEDDILSTLGLPLVLKAPYTRFSSHVEMARSREEFRALAKMFFRKSRVVVLQEFLKSDFDWRVGVLRNEILYLCKYLIPVGGWKVRSKIQGRNVWGGTIAISREKIPSSLEKLCLGVSSYVGNGLYGLDVKEVEGEYKVIEINDNPSIYAGHEDAADGDIYEKIIFALTRG